jgi:hypothetical protein
MERERERERQRERMRHAGGLVHPATCLPTLTTSTGEKCRHEWLSDFVRLDREAEERKW